MGAAIVDVLEEQREFEGVPVKMVEAKHSNGRLRYRKHVRVDESGDEVDHGPDWRWWDNGQIRLQRIWRDGKADGPFLEWHKSGFQKGRGSFAQDLPDGAEKKIAETVTLLQAVQGHLRFVGRQRNLDGTYQGRGIPRP